MQGIDRMVVLVARDGTVLYQTETATALLDRAGLASHAGCTEIGRDGKQPRHLSCTADCFFPGPW